MTDSHIRSEVDDGIATTTIDRPEKRNAMTDAVLADFTDAVWRASHDDTARREAARDLEASPFAVARTKRRFTGR